MFVFSTYLIVFLLKFRSGELVGCGIWFRIQRVPTVHAFDGPCYPKNKKYLKKRDDDVIITFFQVFLVFGVTESIKSMQCGYKLCHHHVFSGISCFWGTRVHQKYVVQVLVGYGIKFCIQRALPLRIWVKTQGDMSKIQTKKVVFFYDKYVNSTIMVDSFYWNSIGSWIPTHKNLFWHVFL